MREPAVCRDLCTKPTLLMSQHDSRFGETALQHDFDMPDGADYASQPIWPGYRNHRPGKLFH